jgi:hypothetical protein
VETKLMLVHRSSPIQQVEAGHNVRICVSRQQHFKQALKKGGCLSIPHYNKFSGLSQSQLLGTYPINFQLSVPVGVQFWIAIYVKVEA